VDSRDKRATARRTKRPATIRARKAHDNNKRAASVEEGKKDAYKDKQDSSTSKRATTPTYKTVDAAQVTGAREQ
jgi:hypothetical protein